MELRSATDELEPLQAKMREYMENGVRLGLLLDPQSHQVTVYRPNREPEVLERPGRVDCGPELSGCVLQLQGIV